VRADFVKAVEPLLLADTRTMFFSGDLGYNALEGLAAKLGSRFVNAGVAEQNMIGVAAGVALTGLSAWVYSIAPFATFRCLEQIRNDVCLHDLPVRIVGNGGGYTYGIMGPTHHALEDLAALKALPNMQLFFPCSGDHVAPAVSKMHGLKGPSYLRLGISGFSTDARALSEQPETLTRTYRRREAGDGVTVVGAGHAVQIVLAALGRGLERVNVDVFGLARHPLSLDLDAELRTSAAATGRVLFVEEHYGPGGIGESVRLQLGSAVREFHLLAPAYFPGQLYGSAAFHLRQCGVTPERVVELASELASGRPARA
jgi:transketolase